MLVGMTQLKPKRTNDQSVIKKVTEFNLKSSLSYHPCCVAVVTMTESSFVVCSCCVVSYKPINKKDKEKKKL